MFVIEQDKASALSTKDTMGVPRAQPGLHAEVCHLADSDSSEKYLLSGGSPSAQQGEDEGNSRQRGAGK